MTLVRHMSMEDVGTRLEHLSDLHELWSWALGQLTVGTYHTETDREQIVELENAIKLLENFMLTGYNQTVYAQAINDLPAKETKDENKRNKPRN